MTDKRKFYGWLAGATVLLTGCWQKSVEPFYTEKDLKTNPALVGKWFEKNENGDDKETVWTFSENGDRQYLLKIVDPDNTYEFDARLFRLADKDFIDIASRKRSLSEIPAHHLLRVAIEPEKLEIKMLSQEWFKNWVNVHPKSISHIRINDPEEPANADKTETVLTAKTPELQKFITEHLNDDGFFDGESVLRRKK